jgi:hypothetical protein
MNTPAGEEPRVPDMAPQGSQETARLVPVQAREPDPPTAAAPPHQPPLGTRPAGGPSRRWLPVVIAVVVMVVAAVAAVLVLTVFSSSSGDDQAAAYKDKIVTVMTPVIAANKSLSSSLQTLHGTRPTPARRRASVAQSATLTARGGLAALTVPSGSEQLATNARGTLTREAAYLAAVSAALSDPASASASQTQTLAGNLTGALDVIAPAQQDWSQSVTGADNLTSWAPKAAAAVKRKKAAAARKGTRAGRNGAAPAPAPAPASAPRSPAAPAGGTDCGGGTHAGPNTSCSFAQNVRDAYNNAPGSTASVQVFSPVTNQTYTMSCGPAGSGVTCSGANNASVTWGR